jgi:hypothetical protein
MERGGCIMNNSIEERIRNLSDEELINIVTKNYKEFTNEALDYAFDEINKRGLGKEEYEKQKEQIKKEERINSSVVESVRQGAQPRYPTLRALSGGYKILGVLIILVGAIALLAIILSEDLHGNLKFAYVFGTISIGIPLIVTYFAIGEGIKVFIDIEENTRQIALNTKKEE